MTETMLPKPGATVLLGPPGESMLVEVRGEGELATQDMSLNIGPQHPATHGKILTCTSSGNSTRTISQSIATPVFRNGVRASTWTGTWL
jgi:hypothetical protein